MLNSMGAREPRELRAVGCFFGLHEICRLFAEVGRAASGLPCGQSRRIAPHCVASTLRGRHIKHNESTMSIKREVGNTDFLQFGVEMAKGIAHGILP